MTFNPNASLDPSQVQDARGGGGGFGGGRGLAVGGGGVGLVIAIVYVLLGGDPSALTGTGGSGNGAVYANGSPLAAECQTGADANTKEDCRIVGYVNSVQAYWKGEFEASGDPAQFPGTGEAWQPAKLYYNLTFHKKRLQALDQACLDEGVESPYTDWLANWEDKAEDAARLTTRVPCGE